MVVVLMGVMGTGKTTIGHLLAARTGWPFAEGDEFHSASNVAKMKAGIPLNDEDRTPWLLRIHEQIAAWHRSDTNGILSCSALKQRYRDLLVGDLPEGSVSFVALVAPKAVLEDRVTHRTGHFMSPKLLDSQLETLEDPRDALHVSVDGSPEAAMERIVSGLGIAQKPA